MKIIRLALVGALTTLLAACASGPAPKDYTAFMAAKPRSILIVPVINHSSEVEAADLFLTTLAVPLAERGYYVFPTNMTKKLMDSDGLSDPQLVHSSDTRRIGQLFNADAVLYVEVLDWKSKYVLTASNIETKFLYTLKDGRTGQLLWQDERAYIHSTSANSGNIFADLIANAVKAAIDNARADYTPVAAGANALAIYTQGQGLPFGPYSPAQSSNGKLFPSLGTGNLSNATTVAVSYPTSVSSGK